MQTQLVKHQTAFEESNRKLFELQQQNDGMSIAMNESLPLEIIELKSALQKANESVLKLTEENQQLLAALSKSSPTSEVLESKNALEKAEKVIETLKTQNERTIMELRENFLDKNKKLENEQEIYQCEITKLKNENQKLSLALDKKAHTISTNLERCMTIPNSDCVDEVMNLNPIHKMLCESQKQLDLGDHSNLPFEKQRKVLMFDVEEQPESLCQRQFIESADQRKKLSKLLKVATE